MEKCDIKTGVFGLDPRTHLLSFLVVGIAAMLVTGLLETALLQLLAAAYLAANGRARLSLKMCASFTVVCGLSSPPALRTVRGAVREFPPHDPAVHGGLRAVHAVTLGDHVRARPLEAAPAGSRGRVHGVQVRLRPLVRSALLIVRGIRMRGIFPHAFDIVRHPGLAYECVYTPLGVMRSLRGFRASLPPPPSCAASKSVGDEPRSTTWASPGGMPRVWSLSRSYARESTERGRFCDRRIRIIQCAQGKPRMRQACGGGDSPRVLRRLVSLCG